MSDPFELVAGDDIEALRQALAQHPALARSRHAGGASLLAWAAPDQAQTNGFTPLHGLWLWLRGEAQYLMLTKLTILVATAVAGLLPTFAFGAERSHIEKQLVQSCRLALASDTTFKASAAGRAKVWSTGAGIPSVTLGAEQEVTCTFSSEAPPQLDMVYIGGCYECGVWLDPDEITRINRLLIQHWSPLPR